MALIFLQHSLVPNLGPCVSIVCQMACNWGPQGMSPGIGDPLQLIDGSWATSASTWQGREKGIGREKLRHLGQINKPLWAPCFESKKDDLQGPYSLMLKIHAT